MTKYVQTMAIHLNIIWGHEHRHNKTSKENRQDINLPIARCRECGRMCVADFGQCCHIRLEHRGGHFRIYRQPTAWGIIYMAPTFITEYESCSFVRTCFWRGIWHLILM